MIRRQATLFVIACSVIPVFSEAAQEASTNRSTVAIEDFAETVFPITEWKPGLRLEGIFATGFCLDPECRFIGTNYHVGKIVQPQKVEGQKVVRRYLATGPDDEGARVNDSVAGFVKFSAVGKHELRYNVSRDLAIFELRRPLARHHGAPFSLDELEEGQPVDIYAYPKVTSNPVRKLLEFQGTFKGRTTTGLLAFGYKPNEDRSIRPGASGGIVVDRKTQRVVGILNGVAKDDGAIALAVPIQSLAEFVTKVDPYLAQRTFPSNQGISSISTDLYPRYVPTHTNLLQHRPEEPVEVKLLRSKAQSLADSMRNFVAIETFAWGTGENEPRAAEAYEVRIIDGNQRFRLYPGGKKVLRDVPLPPVNPVMASGGEWSELPEMVGTELGLEIRQAPDAFVAERRIKVFQYSAGVEDGVCEWTHVIDLAIKTLRHDYTVPCYGEVWTDENINILRISERYELPSGRWRDYQGVVTFGWLQRTGQLWLVPLTISTQAEFHKKIYWCRGQFMDYRMFRSEARLMVNEPASELSVASQ